MFTIEDIQTIVQRFYVKDDKVYARNLEQEIVDEQAVLPIKAAYLIFNEAEIRYKSDLQLLGLKYVSSREKYLEKMMERFSVNGEENDLGQNKLIRDLIACNGHYEETVSSDGIDAKFSIFVEPKKSYGLAYFRLKLREVELDTDDLSLNYDNSNLKDGTARLSIDFKPKVYVDKDDIEMDDTSFEYKFAYDELDKAIKKEKPDRIEYWSDFLKQWKKARLSRDLERLDFLKGIVETVIKDIEKRSKERKNATFSEETKKSTNQVLLEKPSSVEEKKDGTVEVPKMQENVQKQDIRPTVRENGVIEEGKSIVREDVKKSVEPMEQVSIKPLESEEIVLYPEKEVMDEKVTGEVKKVKITNSLLLRFGEILDEIEKKKNESVSQKGLIGVHNDTRSAMRVCNIDEATVFYRGLSIEEKEYASKLMIKASTLLDDKMRCNHWTSIHEAILKELGWPSEVEEILTPELALSKLEKALLDTKGRMMDENENVAIRKYSKICKASWKEYDTQEKLKCAELMKETTNQLKDEINYNYWSGVLDTLSSKIGDN